MRRLVYTVLFIILLGQAVAQFGEGITERGTAASALHGAAASSPAIVAAKQAANVGGGEQTAPIGASQRTALLTKPLAGSDSGSGEKRVMRVQASLVASSPLAAGLAALRLAPQEAGAEIDGGDSPGDGRSLSAKGAVSHAGYSVQSFSDAASISEGAADSVAIDQNGGKIVYLTFDDGPSKHTTEVLDILKAEGIQATFFLLGEGVERHPSIARRISDEGHAIGNHTYNHRYEELYSGFGQFAEQVLRTEAVIYETTGTLTRLLRAPGGTYGNFDRSYFDALAEAGYRVHDWNVDSGDSKRRGVPASEIVANVQASRLPDTVNVLLHDSGGHEQTVKALPDIIAYYKERGYSFKSLNEQTETIQFQTSKTIKWNRPSVTERERSQLIQEAGRAARSGEKDGDTREAGEAMLAVQPMPDGSGGSASYETRYMPSWAADFRMAAAEEAFLAEKGSWPAQLGGNRPPDAGDARLTSSGGARPHNIGDNRQTHPGGDLPYDAGGDPLTNRRGEHPINGPGAMVGYGGTKLDEQLKGAPTARDTEATTVAQRGSSQLSTEWGKAPEVPEVSKAPEASKKGQTLLIHRGERTLTLQSHEYRLVDGSIRVSLPGLTEWLGGEVIVAEGGNGAEMNVDGLRWQLPPDMAQRWTEGKRETAEVGLRATLKQLGIGIKSYVYTSERKEVWLAN